MDLLKDKVFYSNTFNGDPLNLAFVKGTLRYLQKNEGNVYGHIWTLGEDLRDAMENTGIKMIGHAPRMDMVWKNEQKRYDFCAECVRRGVVINRPFYVTLAHSSADVERTATVASEVLSA